MVGEVDLEAAWRRHIYGNISTHRERNADGMSIADLEAM